MLMVKYLIYFMVNAKFLPVKAVNIPLNCVISAFLGGLYNAVCVFAEGRAEKLRHEMEQWLGKVEQGYDLLRTDMDATVSHAAGELERVHTALDSVTEEFNAYDRRLGDLIQAYREENR